MTDTAQTPMPAYTNQRTQQTVRAVKITGVGPTPPDRDGVTELTLEAPFAAVPVDKEFLKRHTPVAGGYYLEDEDGNASFSSASAFQTDYRPRPTERTDPRTGEGSGEAQDKTARKLTAGKFFNTAQRSAALISAEPFDPAKKPWPTGVVDDLSSATKYSLGGGLNQNGQPVAPGDWIITSGTAAPKAMNPADFEATYTSLADSPGDPMALEKFLRRVPRPQLVVGLGPDFISFTLTSIDQGEILEGVIEGNTLIVTPTPRTTNT